MLESLADVAGAILSGGATGLLGTVLSGVLGLFKAKQDLKRELALRELDIRLAEAEGASAERVAALEAEGAREAAAWSALDASYREAAQRWSRPGEGGAMVFVDLVRGLIRPVLTVGLILLAAAIYFSLADDDPSVPALKARIIDTVLYLATAALLWWFGGRAVDKARAGSR